MEEMHVDLAVIGSGPAGQKAAIQAAKLGRSVLVIDKGEHPGGAGLNTGTIPSKSLREAILDLTNFRERSFYGQEHGIPEVSINDLNYRLHQVLGKERDILRRQFRKNHIRMIRGRASFVSPEELRVIEEPLEIEYRVRPEKVMIATGSKPRNPINVPFDDEIILDSNRLLNIGKLPKSMIVLGGGVIGSEYASFFAALGVDVTVTDKKDHMLSSLDAEIGIHLQTALSEIGLKFLGNKQPQEILRRADRAEVHFTDGSSLEADVLLYALGRIANVEGLAIENAGISLNVRGHISVNGDFQTVVPHIYAIGDVLGEPALASTSFEQGRLAARHAFGAHSAPFPKVYPIGIYTIPEISYCGQTEKELQAQAIHYETGRAYYYEIARGQIEGSEVGMFKILFDADSLRILGVHVIGRAATEVIHIGQVAMAFNAPVDFFIQTVFNYPTYAEGYRIAALNGINKLGRLQN